MAATLLCMLSAGCAATAHRVYDQPLAYTRFAAAEAVAMAGFDIARAEPKQVQGDRPIRIGLLLGQGNEHVRVRLSESGARTEVEILSQKRFLGFLAGRHQHERIARALDVLIVENEPLRTRILATE